MNQKLGAAILSASLLLLLVAVMACPQTVYAQTGSGVQYPSGVHLSPPLNAANTTKTSINATTTPTMQAPAENITQEQNTIMIAIIVAAFTAYIAVIAVLSSRKMK